MISLLFCPMDKLVETSMYSVWSMYLQNVYVWLWRQYFMLLQIPLEFFLFFTYFSLVLWRF